MICSRLLRSRVMLALMCAFAVACGQPSESCCGGEVDAASPRDDRSIYQLDAAFTDQNGAPARLDQHRGHAVLIAMIFTHCSFACPAIVADIKRIVEAAGSPADLDVVLVSMDAERDLPPVLRRFAEEQGLDARYTLLHTDASTVAEVAAVLGVRYAKVDGGDFTHSNRITLLDRAGNIVAVQDGLGGGIDAFAEKVRAVVSEH